MKKIAVMTDSNSGITQVQGKELGITVVPMPFFIDGDLFEEDISLTQEDFYQKLNDDADISTSQPTPGDVIEIWDRLLLEYEEIIYIPMSSGLSSSCATAIMLSQDYEGRVQVVDNKRISVTQRQSVMDAMTLVNKGKSALEIKEILEKESLNASIYITLETLKFLKKGGRITPAAATIGSVLNLKPVLQIQGEKLDAYSKTRGKKAAKKIMLDAIYKDVSERFSDYDIATDICISVAYSGNLEEAMGWKEEVQNLFPEHDIVIDPLSLCVACHIGQGALAVACSIRQ